MRKLIPAIRAACIQVIIVVEFDEFAVRDAARIAPVDLNHEKRMSY
jgi:hypothetical protein